MDERQLRGIVIDPSVIETPHNPRECAVCGLTEPLCVHHHDCNRQNNSPDNLIVLCFNHHMLVHRVLRKLKRKSEAEAMRRPERTALVAHAPEGKRADAESAIANVMKVVSDLPPLPSTKEILTRLQTDFEISERMAYYWLKTYRKSKRFQSRA